MGFSALDGGGKEFGVVEDVSRQDLGAMSRFDGMRKAAKRGHGMPCPYEGMERNGRIRYQGGGGEEIVGGAGGQIGWGFRRRVCCERIDKIWDLGFMGIAYNPGDAGEGGELFGGALGVAAGDDEAGGGI